MTFIPSPRGDFLLKDSFFTSWGRNSALTFWIPQVSHTQILLGFIVLHYKGRASNNWLK